MSTTTMHFGPEWMRTKHQPMARPQQPAALPTTTPNNLPAQSGASTYSALVSPAAPPKPERRDETHPFRYSREDLLRIYKECEGRGGLGLEVERWEGVVREIAGEPMAFKEMDEAEKKLFSTPLNSEIRRRQSTTDHPTSLSTQSIGTERPRLGHSNSTISGSPHRDRFGVLMGRRRDSDGPSLTIPRKVSAQALQSPRDVGLSSPRRIGSGFDGVLNSPGDGWLARRKASESMSKAAESSSEREGGDSSDDKKPSEIREGAEDKNLSNRNQVQNGQQSDPSSSSEHGPTGDTVSVMRPHTNAVINGVNAISLADPGNVDSGGSAAVPGSTAPQDTTDLASVEWSYLDPQGHIQGPFRADLMQKWYDDGYFTPDLPTKRTKIDVSWITVDELVRRARGDKPFLTVPMESLPPPGLTRRTESPHNFASMPQVTDAFPQTPYQPAPLANLRSVTLDSFLNTTSGLSESPSSSFGAGRFNNNSPDAFGGRTSSRGSYTLGDPSVGARAIGYGNIPDPSAPYQPVRRETYDADPMFATRSQGFGNIASGRPIDMYGYNGGYPVNETTTWPPAPVNEPVVPNSSGVSIGGRGPGEPMPFPSSYSAPGGNAIPNQLSNVVRMHVPSQESGLNDVNTGASSFANTTHTQPTQSTSDPVISMSFGSLGQVQQVSSTQTPAVSLPSSHDNHVTPAPAIAPTPSQAPAVGPVSSIPAQISSPWNNSADTAQTYLASPFDAPHPKATNTIAAPSVPTSQAPVWNRNPQSSQSSSQANEPSPWFVASHDTDDVAWREPAGPNSLTFSNIVQHNQQQQQLAAAAEIQTKNTDTPPAQLQLDSQKASPPDAEPTPVTPAAIAPASTKSRRKSTSQQQTQKPLSAPVPPLPAKNPSPPPSATPSAPPKPAWSNEDDSRNKPSGLSLSLREIQEAEAKKAEARKAAEREKERAARATISTTTDDAQPFTTSWGLPTSQAGSRSTATPKEPSSAISSSPSVATPPVWTTPAKPPSKKKTMKEIQEEEERRKKVAVKETAAAAVKRGYAETTTKASTPAHPPVTQTNNAWTVVGPSGKAVSGASPSRPPIVTSSSLNSTASVTAPRPNGTTMARASVASVTKVAPTVAKVDDYPINPSHDFLRWLGDSLKGLKSTVSVEDIMQILLSFPLDPDQTTTEIISDLIYEHSTTLDGRRFAAEFISKRKADVSSRPKGAVNGSATNKPISIADVVKSQPKQTQPEWGGFKVVNKKKKGGRP